MEQLGRGVLALVKERRVKQIKINWKFSVQSARTKLNSHYVAIQNDKQKFPTS